MLVGYVSDERYVAIAGAAIEFVRDGQTAAITQSSPRGAIFADLVPGVYQAILVKDGFGSKRVMVEVPGQMPYQFRLLSDRLLGYMWPKWVRAGERSEFRVHAVEPYRLSLWRYGLEREFIRLVGWYDEHGPRAVMQLTPDGDYTQTGVDWNRIGYGSKHHTQFLTAPDRSGLYYLQAKDEAGRFYSFPWIVAPRSPRAPLAVLASTNTWNAYNNFGGRSNYINAGQLPPEPSVNGRQDLPRYGGGTFQEWGLPDAAYAPLSFDRPEPCNHIPEDTRVSDPIAGRQACHLAPAEWRLLGWLEREGYPYDYYSEYQLHSGELDLDAYKVLILSVHPEYWSRQMYRRVKEWVYERNGRLIYLGGNGLNCEIEFIDADTMRCKSQLASIDGAMTTVDPHNPAIRYESRFHRTYECEANLLGVVCSETGIMTAAPYRAINAGHWAFAGTDLQNGAIFGKASLHERCNGGASGHETDKMSVYSPPETVLLAKGLNPEDGGAEITCYELAGGGAVFSAGSITYPASLLVDPAISQITRNVLDRFLEDTPS